ncbi:IS4 family transposase [Streptomyces malaysiensis]|uniref:IS4 family transposase n=1 Tax=Streptomyces malaysiensis TaxID=92644 RepID=UPI002278E44E|nr:IS4 family transposase [Streptomyces sp. SPMA113]MCQ6253275.1 IS4 family transposase [Streptomyces malaysiensis]
MWLPGHLGALTRWVPPSLVDEVVEAAGRGQHRVRLLPSRVMVYFVLAMGLFTDCGYRRVWAALTARWPRWAVADPSAAALRQARRRLGVEPLALLFSRLRGPMGTAGTLGVFWRGLRLVAWDGTCLEVADSEANVARFRRHASRTTRPAGFPQVRLTALIECGTRAVVDAVFGPQQYAEWPQARALLPSLKAGMLLLADRGYDGYEALRDAAATGADVLWRVQSGRLLPVIDALPDGTHLTLVTDRRSGDRLTRWMRHGRRGPMPANLTALTLRVISYQVTQCGPDGTCRTSTVRLVTTLLDPERHPADELAAVYHQRWEIETAYYGLKVTLRGADRVLRSRTVDGVEQELFALLVLYQASRRAITEAATSAGIDPDRLSLTIALHTVRLTVINASTSDPAVLAAILVDARNLAPSRRRSRTSPRCVKRTLSPYAYNKTKGSVGRKTTVTVTITLTGGSNTAEPP